MIIKKGFTMVEMLLVIGLMGIMMVILSQVFGAILTMKLKSEATTAVAQDSRYVINRLSYDVARASAISLPSPSTMILTIAGQSYVYTQLGESLTLSVSGGTPLPLTGVGTRIIALNFSELASVGTKQSLKLSLTIEPTIILSGGVSGQRQLTTTLATR